MPKSRKRKAPSQLNPAKRWLLTWNMNDGNQGASTSCSAIPPIVNVDDVELTIESDISPFSPTSSTHTDGGLVESTVEETVCLAPLNHITKSEYITLWERASYSITLNEQTPKETTLYQLGQITLLLKPHGSSKIQDPFTETPLGNPLRDETLPKQFPRGRCSLFICTPRPHYLVFDYTMGNAENAPTGYSPSVYLCLVAKIVQEPEDVCLDSLQHICHQHKAKLKLVHHGYDYKRGHLSLSVCIPHQGISSPAFAAEFVRRADVSSLHVQRIMHWFQGYPLPAPLSKPVTSKRHDFNKLFDAIRLRHAQNGDDSIVLDVRLQSPCLVPTLREYQRQAVAWMLQKEGYGKRLEEEEAEESVDGKLHCLWSEVRLGQETLYYNVHSGQFTKQRFTEKPSFLGGILADEMGLGKTVEVLACILAHPRYPSSILDSNNDTAENLSSDIDTVMNMSSEFSHQGGNFEDNKESSLLAESGSNNLKRILEVPPGEASLEVPPGEASLEVPPGEALLEVPPGEASMEVPPGEALLEVPPGETLMEVPPGEASMEVPPGEASLEVPPGEALLEVPSGETLMEVHPGEASMEVPPGEASLEVPPGEALLEVPPGETLKEVPPGEASIEVLPGEASLEVLPGEALLEVPPGETLMEVPPGEASMEVAPGEALLEIPLGEASMEVPPGEALLEVPPGETLMEVPPGEVSMEVPPGEASLEVPPGEALLEVPPGETLMEVPPGEASIEVPPGEATLEVPPGEALLEVPPGETLMEVPPWEASMEVPPGEAFLEVPPWETLMEVPPGEASMEVPPGEASLEVPPWETLMEVPPWKASMEVPPGEASLEVPPGEALLEVPPGETLKEVPPGEASIEVPPGEALLEVPPGETLKEVPSGEASIEVLPGEASLEVPPGEAFLEVPPGETLMEVPPGEASMEVPPGEASLEVPPGETLMEVPPWKASMEVPPGEASLEVAPGEALLEVPPGETLKEVPPGEASIEVPPGEASMEVPPGEASSEVTPGEASLEVPSGKASVNVPPKVASVKVSPSEALLEVPPGETLMEVPPGEASIEVPPGEATLEVPPGEALLEVPPGETLMEVPPWEASMEVPPGEAFLEVPPWETLMEVPPGEASMEVPPGEASLEVPPWETLMEVPPWKASMEVPPGEASLEVPPGEALLEVPPGETLKEVPPGEASIEVPPGEALLEVPPGETLKEVPSGEASIEVLPGEASLEVPPGEAFLEVPPGETLMEVPPGEASMEVPPGEASLEVPPGETLMEVPPWKASMEVPPGEASLEVAPGEALLEVPPGETLKEVPPGEASIEVPPGEASMEVPPGEASSEVTPGEASLEVPSGKASVNVPPKVASVKVSPSEASLEVPPGEASLEAKISEADSILLVGRNDTIIDTYQLTGFVGPNSETCKNLSSTSGLGTVASKSHSNCHQGVSKENLPQLPKSGIIKAEPLFEKPTPEASLEGRSSEADHIQYHNGINIDAEPRMLSNSGINGSKNKFEAQTSTGCNLKPSGKEAHQTVLENTSKVNADVMDVKTSHQTTSCELLFPYKPTMPDSVDDEPNIHLKSPESRCPAMPAEESKELIQAELNRQTTVSLVSYERKDNMCNGKDEALTTSVLTNQDQAGSVNKCTDSMAISKQPRSGRNSPSQTSEHFPSTTKEGKGLKAKRKKKQTKKLPVNVSRVRNREAPTFKFQCICGEYEEELDYDLFFECRQCSGWQHKKCVDYRGVPESECSLCPMCCVDQPVVPSGATLIVSPKPICHQWVDEINRHVRAQTLQVLVYEGVRKHGFLHPRTLAKQDIVITTYDTLRSELNYVGLLQTNSQKGRRLRHAKRYMTIPSPLPAVEWWRVCLDEAQMVESPTAKTAEMALQLTAVNRWCVTGTPVQRDLSNIYGLFLFLGVEPYWVKCWWDNILYKPYFHGNPKPMEEALAKVLWRSAKKDVINQINIPAQTEETHWLNFSPIETHFYRRKHEDCSNNFLQVTGRLKIDVKTKLSAMDRAIVHKLMNPLLRLRQACCHPQAVRGEFVSMQRNTLTMAELLQSLTLKAKLESEEAHRQLVCALNGLAAVCIIKGKTLDAIQHYRDVLLSAEEHRDRLKTDSLQRLHAMHNLHQLLKLKPEGLVPTLRDGELHKQVQEIRDSYLAKAEAAVQSSLTSLLPLQDKITDLKDQLSSAAPWWVDGLQWVQFLGLDEEFIDKVKNTLQSTTSGDTLSVVNHFSTVRGLQMVLVAKMDDMTSAYQRLQTGMKRLNVEVTQELVSEATDCHLRPFGGKPKNRCPFCRVHSLFTEYETCLFSIKQRDILTDSDPEDDDSKVTGPRLQGSWAASEAERILRSLLAFLKHHGADEDVLQEGNSYVEMVDTQKKEFKSLRVTWTMLSERVAAWDELKMATMRLRLREAHEPDDVTSQPNVIEPNQLEQQRYKLLNDRVLAQSELKKKLGQLVYLRSLSKAQSDLPEGINPEPCPICVRELGKQWTVLPCGHSFCNNCMEMMRVHNSSQRKTIRCAICRSVSSTLEISFVSTEQTNQEEDSSITVKGGYSTKVEAVVRILLQLRNQDPHVKALIFSTWIDVLTVIAKSLKDNGIEYRSIGLFGNSNFKENLMDFKQEERVTALLMPVHSGSKGLNIIEATHVLLVEPILNPASELQAVGRVHRIGQTRPTVVHRFLVRDTIEERLHAFLQAKHTSASLNNLEGETGAMTLDTLKQLFTY